MIRYDIHRKTCIAKFQDIKRTRAGRTTTLHEQLNPGSLLPLSLSSSVAYSHSLCGENKSKYVK